MCDSEQDQRLRDVEKYRNYLPNISRSYMLTKEMDDKSKYLRYRIPDDIKRFDMNSIHGQSGSYERGMYTLHPLPPHKVMANPGGSNYPRNKQVNYVFNKETNIHAPWTSRFSYSHFPNEYGQGLILGDYKSPKDMRCHNIW